MDVTNYLKFVARIKGVAAADLDRRVETAMGLTGLLERRHELIKRLSRGYKQRVGIAQAIVHNPDVVILDEPTIGLDPNQIIEVRKLIKGLAGEHTVILSTHILPEVEMTCDRVVIINKGRIAAIDTPKNLTSQRAGSERVMVQARGDADAIKAQLSELEGATAVTLGEGEGESEIVAVTVESERGTDLRGKIAAALVNGGFELLELRAKSLSLEDTFRQLTTEETPSQSEK
jgi:ABC-2 type transport system ATP-binding protein